MDLVLLRVGLILTLIEKNGDLIFLLFARITD